MITQLAKTDWNETSISVSICILNFYPVDITEKYGINFFEYEEPGLGKQLGAIVEISDYVYWFFAAADQSGTLGRIQDDPDSNNINREALKVAIRIRSSEKDPQAAFNILCDELRLKENEIYWRRKNRTS